MYYDEKDSEFFKEENRIINAFRIYNFCSNAGNEQLKYKKITISYSNYFFCNFDYNSNFF